MVLRVLALSGYSQNASIFAKQCRKALLNAVPAWEALPTAAQKLQDSAADPAIEAGVVRATGPAAEFVFLDPTVILTKDQLMPAHLEELALYEKTAKVPADAVPRSWWTAPDRKTYLKYDDSLRYLHDFLKNNEPFDGVIGFSQGAAMAAALASLLEKPGLSPDFPAGLSPLKFAIAVGGFKPRSESPDFSAYFPLKTPVLHVMGRRDKVVSEKASKQLVDVCPNSRVEYHEGGHQVPATPEWRDFLTSYIDTVGNGGSAADVPPLAQAEQARL